MIFHLTVLGIPTDKNAGFSQGFLNSLRKSSEFRMTEDTCRYLSEGIAEG